MVASNAAKLIV